MSRSTTWGLPCGASKSSTRSPAADHLGRSAAALREAAEIRSRHGLAEGHALSLFHLALTLESSNRTEEARLCFRRASQEFDVLGKKESAAIARERSAAFEP